MDNLTVIIPIVSLDTEEKQDMFVNAITSVDNSNIIVVGDKDAIETIPNDKIKSRLDDHFSLINNASSLVIKPYKFS